MKVSETIVRNLRVLATDQRATPTLDDKGNTVVTEYKLVTIEATPRIAEFEHIPATPLAPHEPRIGP